MMEHNPGRDATIRALLPIAAAEGWNWRSLRLALRAAGEDPALAESLFPTGPVGAIAAWAELADRDMAAAAAAEGLPGRTPQRIRRLIEQRLVGIAPHKAALRRALSLLALPWNAPLALAATARTVDAMWHAAGDTAADFSWYTKRTTLAGIYAATLAFWLRDEATGLDAALAFLDRRLAELGRIGKLRRGLRPARA
jgi:ubiquinone biosynthesis protein COQ9